MAQRKKPRISCTESASVQYQNRFAQIVSLASARCLACVFGRGSAKTTDIQAERLMDVIYELPGAPCVWVADTFSNLTANILPSLMEGLERKGLREGTHYVIEKAPPHFTEKEKEDLPKWLQPHFWKPFNKLASYSRTMIFYTGTNIRFGSLDRPSTLAGASYVYVFGDEAKYFREDRVANLMKAVRGYRAEYGGSPLYRGFSFTTDMPDPSHVGEYDWILKYAKAMDVRAILLVMQAGLAYNEALAECVAFRDRWAATGTPEALEEYRRKCRTADIWKARWTELRMRPESSVFFMRASSYVNADILTEQWFADAIEGRLPDLNTAILSMKPTLESGERFYCALSDRHFYLDGINEAAYEAVGMRQRPDCRVLRYLDPDKPLKAGVDFGNMCSMAVAQDGRLDGRDLMRVLTFLYTLAPQYVGDLGAEFCRYFSPMRNKTLQLYYDRAGNAYRSVGADQVGKLKRAIEFNGSVRTGWTVQLMSVGQGNIPQAEEYAFQQELLSEHNPRLPVVRIDYFACKYLRLSLEGARTRVKDGVVHKDKSSEKLPIAELPSRSTNPSDAFKYLTMTKPLMQAARGNTPVPSGSLDPRFK